jgi:MFS transporter, PAT family, beta-lactamase induction signal transducer AmpG
MLPGFILSYYILYTFLTIAILATAMELCWKRIAATQFTLYMAINNMGIASGAGFLGFLKDHLHAWEYVILVYAVAALIMFLLLLKMNTKNHAFKVDLLESKHTDKLIF